MRNSTGSSNAKKSSETLEIRSQVAYMTRSRKSQSFSDNSKNSHKKVANNKKTLNHYSNKFKINSTSKNKLNNHRIPNINVSNISQFPSKKISADDKSKSVENGQNVLKNGIPEKRSKASARTQSKQIVPEVSVTIPTDDCSSRTRSKTFPKVSHVCEICHKEFNSRSKLQKHATRHDPKKPYGCEVCGKFFDDARFVKTHRTLHEKKSRKECDICGKVFNERIFFDIHRLTHFEQKPFRCDICEDIFKDKTTFLRHRNNHKARVKKVAERFLSMKEVLKQKLKDSK